MNVGFALLTLFPGRVGGSDTNVRGLLGEFAGGHGPQRVTVLANRHVMAAFGGFERGPVSLHHVASYRPGDSIPTRALAMGFARALPRRVSRDVPGDLDLVHYPVTVPIPETDLPRLVTVYDVQHHDLPRFFSRGERAFRRWAYDGAARQADVVLTTSEFSRGRIAELLGVAPQRIEVVHPGIDAARFSPDAAEDDAERLAGLDLPERFVLYPANLWPHKNHSVLVRALARSGDRELGLVLTGQDYGRLPELRRAANAAGVAERVRHLGHLPHASVPALLRRATALVFPSLYEGFGAPPLEAMACGLPVAASDRASLPEVCGDAALQFDPSSVDAVAEAIGRVAGEAELRAELRARGLARAASFTWRAAAERHRAIYERAGAATP